MADNLFEAQYDITKKSRLKKFYESNKILIYLSIFILIILFGYLGYYLEIKEKKKILLSENYVQAKIYLSNGSKVEALNILKELDEHFTEEKGSQGITVIQPLVPVDVSFIEQMKIKEKHLDLNVLYQVNL